MQSDGLTPVSLRNIIGWIATAAAMVWAAWMSVSHATPIDHALPMLAAIVTALAAFAHRELLVAVPLMVVIELTVPDDTARLLALGFVVAMTFAFALRKAPVLAAVLAIVVLRWIPFGDVLLLRELLLLWIAASTVVAMRRTPFGAAVAVVIALVTPMVPLRTLVLPLMILAGAALVRPRWRLSVPSAAIIALPLLFFAWSGIVARALPYFLKDARPAERRHIVNAALAPNRSVTVDVPHDAKALIVSGANVPRFGRGYILGYIEPGGIEVRIGDAADWGYMRLESFYAARNPLPRDPAGKIRGWGYGAWVDGAGRVELPKGARTIRITAAAHLPEDAALQVEAFELP